MKDCPEKKEDVGSSVITRTGNNNEENMMQKYKHLEAAEISELLNVPVSKGKVNGREVMIMRDSGFSFAAVCAKYVLPEQYLDEYEDLLLMDCTPRRFQKARIFVESQYYTGELEVFVVDKPVVDLVFGNVKNMQIQNKCHMLETENTKFITKTCKPSFDFPETQSGNTEHGEINSCEKEMEDEPKQNNNAENHEKSKNERDAKSSAAAITRSQNKKTTTKSSLIVPSPEAVDREAFKEFQKDDKTLEKYRKLVCEEPHETKKGTQRKWKCY